MFELTHAVLTAKARRALRRQVRSLRSKLRKPFFLTWLCANCCHKEGSTISVFVVAWFPLIGTQGAQLAYSVCLFLHVLPHILVWSRIPLLSSSGWCAGGGQPPLQQGGADPCDKASSSSDSDGGASLPISCWTRWRSFVAHLGTWTHTVQGIPLTLCMTRFFLKIFSFM